MKVAIHHREGSFSERWVQYCVEHSIPYTIVNAYESSIVEKLRGFDVFLWHYHHGKFQDVLFAKQLLMALETSGKKVFPDCNTSWHFDDKVGQKYLLESIDAPLVPSYVFYNEVEALEWAKNAVYPKVFKLRGGAGATNVSLVQSFRQCKSVIRKAFTRGFSSHNRFASLQDGVRRFKKDRDVRAMMRSLAKFLFISRNLKMLPRQKGYVYFQEFIPNNDYDIRLIVINGKYVYGMKRMNRENDFRASGSSSFHYRDIPLDAVALALETAQKLKLQSIAFDIIYAEQNPLIIEMSYGFGTKGSDKCPGYWDEELCWHEGSVTPMAWVMDSLIKN